jgi:hypothetical protein
VALSSFNGAEEKNEGSKNNRSRFYYIKTKEASDFPILHKFTT